VCAGKANRQAVRQYSVPHGGQHQFSGISLSLNRAIHLIETLLYQAMLATRGPGRLHREGSLDHPNYRAALTRRLQRRHLQHDDPGWGDVMDNQVPKYVTQARASFLLGMSEAELSRISKESGLGHAERAGSQKETYFTYEELQRICRIAERQMETIG
jgi:hypothetical protein